MPGRVIDRDRGWGRFVSNMKKLATQTDAGVYVGIHAEEGAEVVVIAATNEFGSSDGRIPERSYLRSTVDERKRDISDRLTKAVDRALEGRSLEQELGVVGEEVAGWVKDKVRDLDTPPNAPSTIERKGFDNPLIETGQHIRNRIRAKVR